jgi:hypothetical protein
MKSLKSISAAAVILLSSLAFSQTDSQKAFATIRSLSGSWVGTKSDGKPVALSFKGTAAGTAVMSEIAGHAITMFHMDGPDKLLLTHYCAAGNQPRMQASVSPDGKIITFNFLDATNLDSLDTGHMKRVIITVIDPDHHTEEWTFADHGKENKQVFDVRRKS